MLPRFAAFRSATTAVIVCLAAMAIAGSLGCEAPAPAVVAVQPPAAEIPVVSLPETLRQWNWRSTQAASYGEGSCVIASSCSLFNWLGRPDISQFMRQNYAGGQTARSVQQIWSSMRVEYCATEGGDPEHLEWCSRTRRGAIIWFFPNHCVTFCGYSRVDGADYAILLDNNRCEQYLRIPHEEFVRAWRQYGGFAATPLLTPTSPKPWPAYVPARQEQ